MKILLQKVAILYIFSRGVKNRFIRYILRHNFKNCGRNVKFNHKDVFTYKNITIGNDVYVGPGAVFLSTVSEITIGNKILFGPNVTIITGDHPTDLRGEYIYDIKEKRVGEDLPVIIEDDVWIGTGAIILKGVKIERGSIVAAGAVVNKNVPPYAIVGGIPAKILKFRGDLKQISDHEIKLYCIK